MSENALTRRDIPEGFGERSLDILSRTVMIPMDPSHSQDDLEALSHNIRLAASEIRDGGLTSGASYRDMGAPDLKTFDAASES